MTEQLSLALEPPAVTRALARIGDDLGMSRAELDALGRAIADALDAHLWVIIDEARGLSPAAREAALDDTGVGG